MSSLKDKIKQAQKGEKRRVEPLVNAWLHHQYDNGGIEWSDETLAMAQHVLKRKDGEYPHMRNSPSNGASCIRSAVIGFMGHNDKQTHDIGTRLRFLDGDFGHLMWQMVMFEMGILVDAEIPVGIPDMWVAGTADGLLSVPLEGYDKRMSRQDVLDLCKTVDTWDAAVDFKRMFSRRYSNNKTYGSEDKVVWQLDVYAYGLGTKNTCFWYQNKDTNEVYEIDRTMSDERIEEMKAFYKSVHRHYKKRKLPAAPFKEGDKACKWCRAEKFCRDAEKKKIKTIDVAEGLTMGDFRV